MGWRRYQTRKQALAQLPPPGQEIPEEKGFARLTVVPPDVVEAAVSEARHLFDSLEFPSESTHLRAVHLGGHLQPGNPVLRMALDPNLLSVVANYIGMAPVIEDIVLLYSPNDHRVSGSSQHLHLDGQDIRMIQVFVFVEDVDDANGPLTAITASASERIAQRLGYRVNQWSKRVDDEAVQHLVTQSDMERFTGPRGTTIAFDSDRCFHFGSREGTRPRYVLALQYYSPFAFSLAERGRTLPFKGLASDPSFSPVEQLVLGAE